ncbi:phage holin family protein [Pelagibacterium xiamenense]|uniref:phage holin family protein n=1 Tax=Pelagibacterium xiamenense TaxID=2901140 RepID=UPI001E29D258|nr:phage holin family protein [Pelagibacterium xiamenense]MCD7058668.1 phage holin family protein [Pelagibacterium xiamenense]
MTTPDPTPRDPGIAELVSGLFKDVAALFRQEIELAKTEAGERLQGAVRGGQFIAVGAALAIGGFLALLGAVVIALGAWLETTGLDPAIAYALSALATGIVVGLAGGILISSGVGRIRDSNFKLTRTVDTLREDIEAAKERF